jgi:hypothetical protein
VKGWRRIQEIFGLFCFRGWVEKRNITCDNFSFLFFFKEETITQDSAIGDAIWNGTGQKTKINM